MSSSELQLYVDFIRTTNSQFEQYIKNTHTFRPSYQIKKAVNSTIKLFKGKKSKDITDDNIM
ncbi:MAG: hypothetical protein J6V40_04685, partial [Clostridia bacterium]|nr:hypothetical protein [Clostridia bacterium]